MFPMACDEAGVDGSFYGARALRALALRILRTEKKPVDPDLVRAREIVSDASKDDALAIAYSKGNRDSDMVIRCVVTALKEGRKHG